MSEYKRLRVGGHKLLRSRSGPNDAYVSGKCECGQWESAGGFCSKLNRVIGGHNRHLEEVKASKVKA